MPEQPEQEITLSKPQLDALPVEEINRLLLLASKVSATCVVRRADGSIKYDDPALAGTYGEQFLDEERKP